MSVGYSTVVTTLYFNTRVLTRNTCINWSTESVSNAILTIGVCMYVYEMWRHQHLSSNLRPTNLWSQTKRTQELSLRSHSRRFKYHCNTTKHNYVQGHITLQTMNQAAPKKQVRNIHIWQWSCQTTFAAMQWKLTTTLVQFLTQTN